jgi:hypothetical protein
MVIDYAIGGAVDVLLLPRLPAAPAGEVLRSATWVSNLLQTLIYLALTFAAMPLLGGYMARVFAGERTLLSRSSCRSSGLHRLAACARRAAPHLHAFLRSLCPLR